MSHSLFPFVSLAKRDLYSLSVCSTSKHQGSHVRSNDAIGDLARHLRRAACLLIEGQASIGVSQMQCAVSSISTRVCDSRGDSCESRIVMSVDCTRNGAHTLRRGWRSDYFKAKRPLGTEWRSYGESVRQAIK